MRQFNELRVSFQCSSKPVQKILQENRSFSPENYFVTPWVSHVRTVRKRL